MKRNVWFFDGLFLILCIMAKSNKKKQGGRQQVFSPLRFIRERMRSVKIAQCYMTGEAGWDEGEGYVVVIREHTGGKKSFAVYLVDRWCVGVKDTFFNVRVGDDVVEDMLSRMNRFGTMDMVSYEQAHNMVWGAVAFAEEAGIKPCKDFAVSQYYLEEDTDDVPLIEYDYGLDGKYYLVAKDNLELSKYLQPMRKNLAEGDYEYVVDDGFGDYGFDDEEYADEEMDDEDEPVGDEM